MVLVILSGLGYGVAKYFNYGVAGSDNKIEGLPNQQLRFSQTSAGDLSSLTYETSGSLAFNYSGKNVRLKMTTYQYGKKAAEKILGPENEELGKKKQLSGFLTLGLRYVGKDQLDSLVDYAISISGQSMKFTLDPHEYGLAEGDNAGFSQFGVGKIKHTLFSKKRYVIEKHEEIPILTLVAGNKIILSDEPKEVAYQDVPWVMVISLEFR